MQIWKNPLLFLLLAFLRYTKRKKKVPQEKKKKPLYNPQGVCKFLAVTVLYSVFQNNYKTAICTTSY